MKKKDVNRWLRTIDSILFILKRASIISDASISLTPVSYSIYFSRHIIIGLALSISIAIFLVIVRIGVMLFEKILDWLTFNLRRKLQVRWFVALIFTVAMSITTPMTIIYLNMFNFVGMGLFLCFGLLLPSTFFSLVGDDIQANKGVLPEYDITRDLILKNPQAAIENAFTVFEDTLRKKLVCDAGTHGVKLIDLAFSKGGQLSYSDIEEENMNVRHLLAGAYGTFRNPLKHRLIKYDEITAMRIISLIELALHIVETSSKKTNP